MTVKYDVEISKCGYVARFDSSRGGVCIKLIGRGGENIFRTPTQNGQWKKTPFLYGNAILFPPNRIRGGRFTFEGRQYSFPVNEPSTGAFLHGELYMRPFSVAERSDSAVTFAYSAESGEYLGFPHAFTLLRHYSLDCDGLTEITEIVNRSPLNMPFMLAFHTTFDLRFAGGARENCRIGINVGREEMRGADYLPTGEWRERGEREQLLIAGQYVPTTSLSAFYEINGGEARLTDAKNGKTVVYSADGAYKYRMLWSDGSDLFVCEPQTSAIDCFNIGGEASDYGLIVIAPGQSVRLKTNVRIIDGK